MQCPLRRRKSKENVVVLAHYDRSFCSSRLPEKIPADSQTLAMEQVIATYST